MERRSPVPTTPAGAVPESPAYVDVMPNFNTPVQGLAGRRVASVTSLAFATPIVGPRATSRASTASPGSGKVLLTDV